MKKISMLASFDLPRLRYFDAAQYKSAQVAQLSTIQLVERSRNQRLW
ncbi:MAG: hypothetical protein RM347_020480 [Nostoc sp. ChiQUE02]|nr:hypothetical protein [Nostoc sp. ChiQUE02]MDZ8233223.1 hypothetical protein [Nostoc sp. ChiQUE02]